MQDIADELGVSRVTVWKVFNNYSNVSSALREKVLNKAKEMGYTKGIAELEQTVPEKNISLIVSRPNSQYKPGVYLHALRLFQQIQDARCADKWDGTGSDHFEPV